MTSAPPDSLPLGQILIGDARQRLKELPPSSVDCVITSPPYYALRDYGHENQLGLEANVYCWVSNLVELCDELARVLRPSGSLWLNVGDGYSAHIRQGAVKKGLLLGPQRLAIALAERGWILRNHIVWSKKNPMPSSVRDRFSNGHEVLLFCVRSRFYHFDLDPIRQPHRTPPQRRRPISLAYQYLPTEVVPEGAEVDLNLGLNKLKAGGLVGHPLGGNPTDVWSIPTAAYHGAHFATFPIALVERPLLATCPAKVCAECGVPWNRAAVDRNAKPLKLGELEPICDCHALAVPGVVLDPFMGAGTTALAAEMHGRQWIGIELNPTYAALAQERLAGWRAKQQLNKEN
jgi:DNA modification methylase